MRRLVVWVVIGIGCGLAGAVWASDGPLLVADFEGEDYGDWTVAGEAFGEGPAQGTLPGQMPVSGYLGHGLVNSFAGGDGTTGTLTSPVFRIERPYLNFLIGGGGFQGVTCMNLMVEGEVVRTATGTNVDPGGSEKLSWQSWDVSEWVGEEAVLRIVDQRRGPWGHINIDQIMQSKESHEMPDLERVMTVTEPSVFLPVSRDAALRRVDVFEGEELVRSFEVGLADGVEDHWMGMTVGPLLGKVLRFRVEQPYGSDPRALERLVQGAIPPDGGDMYREAFRPQFHFTTQRGWNNDPNGLVYYAGEYHLFYQHNPYGCQWGNMTWGHAVSPDLVHWTELGDAIHPDALGSIFSGSAVVDERNTTGFQTGSEKPLVAIYTYAGGSTHWSRGADFTQALAYSNDKGRTWTKYEANPVQEMVEGGNRDPKVIWHEPSGRWVIVLYLENQQMGFFTSKDLKSWNLESRLDCGFHECPELFVLPVDGDPEQRKWVLYGGTGDYLLGQFDGKIFTPETEAIRYHYGTCFYASQTYSDIPAEDGRRIQIAWGGVGHPDMPFNQMMDFPVELTLRGTDDGPRLFVQPVREIAELYDRVHAWEDVALPTPADLLSPAEGRQFDIEAEFDVTGAERVGLDILGIPVVYDVAAAEVQCLGAAGPLALRDGTLKLRILVDALSIEIYAGDGRLYMPMRADFKEDAAGLKLIANGEARLRQLTVRELASAWEW